MSPISAPVLGAGVLVSAPALWDALVVGSSPLADALLHLLVAWAACWCGLELLTAMIGPPASDGRSGE